MTSWRAVSSSQIGVVIYNFNEKGAHKLKLQLGETVQVLEENGGWYRGFSLRNKNSRGIFPISYVKLRQQKNGQVRNNEGVLQEISLVEEMTSVLREWGNMWQNLYLRREDHLFLLVKKQMAELMDWRRQILSETLPGDQLKQLKQKVTSTIDYGNRIIGLDLVVRNDDGNILDPDSTGVIELYRRHLSTSNKIQSSSRDESKKLKREAAFSSTHNIYVNIKNVVCNINDDAEVFISLYDARDGEFISEQFVVNWDKAGMPKEIDKLYNLTVLFTDLGTKDLKRDRVFLVCQIIRVGRMDLKEPASKKLTKNLRRCFGGAVLNLSDLMSGKVQYEDDKEHFLQLHVVPFRVPENQFMHDWIKKMIASQLADSKGTGQGIWVSVKVLEGNEEQIREENPLLMNKHTAIARKQGFPEVIMPGDVRNDLYVTVLSGEFERGHKTANKNIEVTMHVLSDNGDILENVISYGAGEDLVSEYRSVIYYHSGKPEWHETIKLAVPIEQFYESHLRFTFKHRSSGEEKDKSQKVFAFAFVRLMQRDGTTLKDGTHELMVFKCNSTKVLPSTYLQSASFKIEQTLMNPPTKGGADAAAYCNDKFNIKTLLCSTKLTQNLDLLGLLKWRQMPGKLKDVLVTLMKVSGEEIVKFLTDTFDALFAILNENARKYDKLVFDALVFTISLLADKKYHHFRPVLEAYIDNHFAATIVHSTLIAVYKEYIAYAERDSLERARMDLLLKAMKAMEYIFKFIVQSRILYERFNGSKGHAEFQEDLRGMFHSLVNLMTNTKNETLLTQGAALKYFPATFEHLLQVFDAKELAYYARDFIEKIPEKRLTSQRLDCIHNMVKSPLFEIPDSRCVLLPMAVSQIGKEMDRNEEMIICIDVLNDILIMLMRKDVGLTHEDVFFLVVSLLRVVVKAVIKMDRSQPVVGSYVACLIAMLQLMDEDHYRMYIDQFSSRLDLLDFLMELFLLFREFVSNNVYPKDWVVMTMVQNSVILNTIQYFSEALHDSFFRDGEFEYQLWNNFFHLSVAFITQESLQLEDFSQAKQDKILEKYSDMRMIIGLKINDMWHSLGSHKIKFIPGLVGPFLEMTLIPQTDLRKATIPIFYDMIEVEHRTTGGFVTVETEMMSKLDVLVEGGKGNADYKELFHQILFELFNRHPQLKEEGLRFVQLLTQLMERLLDYRTVVQGDENIDNRMSCIVNVLNFYKEIRREEMFIRYVYKLCDMHLAIENYTEAAFTLLLHADLLEWCDQPVFTGQGKYQATTQRQLKESLYTDMIDYFDKGKCWEEAISMCKQLSKQYEEQTFDYIKLSHILNKQAKFYDNIITQVRGEPEYFRVAFYGKGFPTFLRDKVFIYRGKEYERLSDFCVRIQSQYPSAKMLNYLTRPEEDIINSSGQHMQINKVNPVPVERRKFRGKNVMEQITRFYDVNSINKFQYSRVFHKGIRDKECEFKTMWLERTILYTKYKFPGILCWFEVISSDLEEVSPIRNALETMMSKNKELRSLIGMLKADPNLNVNPLTQNLQGTVDAAVMGGTSNYEKLFLIPEYLKENPDHQQYVDQLKELLVEQVDVLEEGIRLHGTRIKDNIRPLHEIIETGFKQKKAHFEQFRKAKPSVSSAPPRNPRSRLTIQPRSSDERSTISSDEMAPPILPLKHNKQSMEDTPGEERSTTVDGPPKPPRPTPPESLLISGETPPSLPSKGRRPSQQRGSTASSGSGGDVDLPSTPESVPVVPPRRQTIRAPKPQDSPPVPPKSRDSRL
ncbi:dedicator of cytokinesis protein 1 isoform X2 [Nematostella vectensis]|uniref:dedicator of cytokinesis protein 1 isoform X2 n=1 Tax=Nematostella vectensis TaxID=45351 RepID=UPI00207707EA|nr:dedicator of cytokinesis protein 1 isoform X2 [Nematostella vectensis]